MSQIEYIRDRRVDEMAREELIDVVRELGAKVAAFYKPEAIRERALGKVAMLKNGERRP